MKKCFFLYRKGLILLILSVLISFNIFSQVDKVYITFERVSERVLVVWGGKVYKDQVIAISTEKGIVLIDTGKAPSLTKKYREIIEREFGRSDFRYVINTHFHYDHTSGNQIFPEATIISHQKSPGMMKDWAETRHEFVKTRRANQMMKWADQIKETKKGSGDWVRLNDYITTGIVMLDDYENNYELTLPHITFNDKMTLDLGDLSLKMYYFGEGRHTGDDILIVCPEEKLLFTGDLFAKGWYGISSRPYFDADRWTSVLAEIFDNYEIDWAYDVHNSKVTGNYLKLQSRYITEVWQSLSVAHKKGESFELVQMENSFEKKYTYIIESGIKLENLKAYHQNNLKTIWERLNNSL